MSITTTNKPCDSEMHLGKAEISRYDAMETGFEQPLTVPSMVKTMLEIIKVKKSHSMDEETRKQFPVIAKEIVLLAEQTQ